MFKFSQNSKNELATMEPQLSNVFYYALSISDVDFGISKGHRLIQTQKELYAQGRTKPGPIVTNVDGVKNLSNHNFQPSRAGDIYAFVNRRVTYDQKYMMYLGGVIMAAAKVKNVPIRWGANWDGDGIIYTDHNLRDAPHFEMILTGYDNSK